MSDSDTDLVRKAQADDRTAFEELVRRTSRLAFARLYLETGDASRLNKFRGKSIKDADGAQIPFLTDRAELNRLGSAGVLAFESLYARSA